jgi:hypothetical protein
LTTREADILETFAAIDREERILAVLESKDPAKPSFRKAYHQAILRSLQEHLCRLELRTDTPVGPKVTPREGPKVTPPR